MEITTPNLDQGTATPEFYRNQSRVKFELLSYNPYEVEVKKPSFLSRFFSVLGGFAPLAAVAAPFTGGLSLIGAAGLAGLGAVGQKAQYNHYAQQQAAAQGQRNLVMTYPGLGQPGISPAVFSSDPALALISTSRDNALYSSSQVIGK